jgi:hypothetical protein
LFAILENGHTIANWNVSRRNFARAVSAQAQRFSDAPAKQTVGCPGPVRSSPNNLLTKRHPSDAHPSSGLVPRLTKSATD